MAEHLDTLLGEATATIDGNEAAARIAYAVSEVIAIYPITPASPMGEHSDDWCGRGPAEPVGRGPRRRGDAVRGGRRRRRCTARCRRARSATTFTASQGLLLMIPNMFKIAGELTPAVIHVAARDDRDARAVDLRRPQRRDARPHDRLGDARAGSVQEAHDFALVAHAATLRARVPFLHFFDGFRTSHEINKIDAARRRRRPGARPRRRRPRASAPAA